VPRETLKRRGYQWNEDEDAGIVEKWGNEIAQRFHSSAPLLPNQTLSALDVSRVMSPFKTTRHHNESDRSVKTNRDEKEGKSCAICQPFLNRGAWLKDLTFSALVVRTPLALSSKLF
jgi:hypothetical protein